MFVVYCPSSNHPLTLCFLLEISTSEISSYIQPPCPKSLATNFTYCTKTNFLSFISFIHAADTVPHMVSLRPWSLGFLGMNQRIGRPGFLRDMPSDRRKIGLSNLLRFVYIDLSPQSLYLITIFIGNRLLHGVSMYRQSHPA